MGSKCAFFIDDLPRMLPTKFRFIWQSGFREEDFLEINQSETRIACGANSCLWCSCWWTLDFSFKSYGKESLYKYCMNVDDGHIMRSWRRCLFKIFFSETVWPNEPKKYTGRKTINSNNCAKFEVNWPRGSQFTARRTKNRLQFDE
jgi:hypothetical protein